MEEEIPASSEVPHIRSKDIYMYIHAWANESSKNVHGKNKTIPNSIYNFSKRYSQLLEAKYYIFFIVHTYLSSSSSGGSSSNNNNEKDDDDTSDKDSVSDSEERKKYTQLLYPIISFR